MVSVTPCRFSASSFAAGSWAAAVPTEKISARNSIPARFAYRMSASLNSGAAAISRYEDGDNLAVLPSCADPGCQKAPDRPWRGARRNIRVRPATRGRGRGRHDGTVRRDRTRVVWGQMVSVRVELGGRPMLENKK